MKIKLEDKILDYQKKEILSDGKNPLLIRDIISASLNNTTQDERLTSEQKNKIFQLSVKVWSDKEVDFTLDDRHFIKERAGKILNPLMYGRLCEILEEKK